MNICLTSWRFFPNIFPNFLPFQAKTLMFMASFLGLGFLFFGPMAMANNSENPGSMLVPEIYTAYQSVSLDFESILDTTKISYSPNARGVLGVGVTLFDLIGVSIGGVGPMTQEERISKGYTSFSDYRFMMTPWDRLFLQAAYVNYTGFYIANSSYVDPTKGPPAPYIQSPNLNATLGLVSLTYIWSPETFSLNAAVSQIKRQLKSGGSTLTGVTAKIGNVTDNGGLLPAQMKSHYGADQDLTQIQFQDYLLHFGYGYTFSFWENYFFNLTGYFGLGPETVTYTTPAGITSLQTTSAEFFAFTSLGYNGPGYFAGFNFYIWSSVLSTKTIHLSTNPAAITFFYGFRI